MHLVADGPQSARKVRRMDGPISAPLQCAEPDGSAFFRGEPVLIERVEWNVMMPAAPVPAFQNLFALIEKIAARR